MSSPVSLARVAMLATFSERFKELCAVAGLAPKEVAELCGVTTGAVYKWRAGDTTMPYVWHLLDLTRHIAPRLGVDSDEILLWLVGRRSQAPFAKAVRAVNHG